MHLLENERSYNFEPIDDVDNFRDFIKQFNTQYIQYAGWKRKQLTGYGKTGDLIADSFYTTFVVEAKRVRPLFAYFTHRLFNNNYHGKDIIKLGTALEYFHNFALIHDDITDLSLIRRGVPTIEADFREKNKHRSTEDAYHIGLNAAMYAGDIALFQSTYILETMDLPQQITRGLQDTFYAMQTDTAMGQIEESLGVAYQPWETVTRKEIENVLILKSGRYTIQKPMQMGAIMSDIDNSDYNKLSDIADDFGLVFQIKDDLLGLFGLEEEIGKSASSDITEGKKTLIMYDTYQRAGDEGKKNIRDIVGKRNATLEEINIIKRLVETTGVRDETEKYCKQGAAKFKTGLNNLSNININYLAKFEELADYIVERTK
jgi:geranylgeranyl diphosphate synthase, type I